MRSVNENDNLNHIKDLDEWIGFFDMKEWINSSFYSHIMQGDIRSRESHMIITKLPLWNTAFKM